MSEEAAPDNDSRAAGAPAVRRVARTLPVAFVVHDLEEVLTATWWARRGPVLLRRAHPWLPTSVVSAVTRTTTPQMAVATSVVGAAVATVVATALLTGRERPLRAATLVFAAHGVTHLSSAAAVRGYTPGALTAATVVLPWGGWALRLLSASDDRPRRTRRRDTAAVAAGTVAVALVGHALGRRIT